MSASSGPESPNAITLIRARDALPAGFDALCAEAGNEGYRMLDRLARDWQSGTDRYAREGEALLAAYCRGVLAGVGGLTHDTVVADALRMRRFYIRPGFRRLGIGFRLAEALLSLPRGSRPLVTVNAGTPDAPAFWHAMGFVADPTEDHSHILRPDRCA